MNSEKYTIFKITANDSNKRVDNIIRKFLNEMPMKSIFKSIRSGDIRVNGNKIKQNHRLTVGDELMIYSPLLNNKSDKRTKCNLSIQKNRIIFENSDLLIYNKPKGELVHGSVDSLDKKITNYLNNKVTETLSFKPGPLHRLDRNTSGLITFSVSLNGARKFTNYLQSGLINKCYLTIVDGIFTKKERWNDKIDRDENNRKSFSSDKGKEAVTHFIPLFSKNNKTFALIKIETGRTHQIRVHCSIHGRPLTGDIKYNRNTIEKEYYLNAICLTFPKNSGIVNYRENFILSLKTETKSLLNKILSENEIEKLETLIKKELQ